jgi:anti-sigma regulatory factor (Ser/Thr protein kinase)
MATVEVAFTPLPAHVRTARLVATAVARRSGVDEELLDEVRLAVGEACSRAVEAHRRHCPAEPIRIEMSDLGERFEVIVRDAVPSNPSQPVSANGAAHQPAAAGASFPAGFGLAVISGLADDVRISATGTGVSVRMTWPAAVPASSLTAHLAPLARNEISITSLYRNCHDRVSKLLGIAAGS